jgi:glycosyltransferase involved in cell wall biosynthesis
MLRSLGGEQCSDVRQRVYSPLRGQEGSPAKLMRHMARNHVSISAIIPAFNSERYVGQALDSVLAQTIGPGEIVCVDDGSSDGTVEILKEYAARHTRVIRVISQENRGPSAARNRGLEVVTGQYIQFLDSDDLIDPGKWEHQVRLIDTAGNLPDMVAAAYDSVDMESGRSRTVRLSNDPWIGLFEGGLGITSSNLWKSASVRGVGGWNETRLTSEDPDLMFRLLKAGCNFLFDQTSKTSIRRRPDSQWNTSKGRSRTGWFTLRAEVLSFLDDNPDRVNEAVREEVARLMWNKLSGLYAEDPVLCRQMLRELPAFVFRDGVRKRGVSADIVQRLLGTEALFRMRRLRWRGNG